MSEQKQVEPAWCVAANIVYEHPFGEQREVLRGTKHFAPGAKVYCIGLRYEAEHTSVQVVGRHRKSGRTISVWMKPAHLANWRVELVYSPAVTARSGSRDGGAESKSEAEAIVNSWVAQKLGAGTQPFSTREKSTRSSESSID